MAIGQIVGKQPAPATGPVATGQAYAQQIAGGIPFEQVVAPGLQFSPEAPMGLTQEQLNLIAQGPAPVLPVAPTIGEPVAPSEPMMPFAPVGTPEPSLPFIPPMQFDLRDIGRPTLFDFDVEGLLKDVEPKALEEVLEQVEAPSLFDFELPQLPQAPVMPQVPVMPQAPVNLTGLPQINLPQIEDIVSPIRTGRTVQPSIFGFGSPSLIK